MPNPKTKNPEPEFTCPGCRYEGPFQRGKVPFFVFSLLDAQREKSRARRTYVCPECGTVIVLPQAVER